MPTLDSTNSYATYLDYAAYTDLTGQPTLDSTVIEPLLVQATLAIDRKYGGRFLGRKTSPTQPLQWPRVNTKTKSIDLPEGFYSVDADGNYRDFNVTPIEVIQATCETAIGLLDSVTLVTQESPAVTEESVKVDVISTTTKYAVSFQQKTDLVYLVDVILRPLLSPTTTSLKFVV